MLLPAHHTVAFFPLAAEFFLDKKSENGLFVLLLNLSCTQNNLAILGEG